MRLYKRGSGIGALFALIIFPACLLTARLFSDSDGLSDTAALTAIAAGLVLLLLLSILSTILLSRLPDFRRRRIEKICDLLAFSVLPCLLFCGIGILSLLDGQMETSFILPRFIILPLILGGITGFLILREP